MAKLTVFHGDEFVNVYSDHRDAFLFHTLIDAIKLNSSLKIIDLLAQNWIEENGRDRFTEFHNFSLLQLSRGSSETYNYNKAAQRTSLWKQRREGEREG